MDLHFDESLAEGYHSLSQKVRVMSENWVLRNVYCPKCGRSVLTKHANNYPVGDFFCEDCRADYEVKAKKDHFSSRIADGAYNTMIERITQINNPNLLALNYVHFAVCDLFVVPNYFFTPQIIKRRNRLSMRARRSDWIGCSILLSELPEYGKIYLIRNGECVEKSKVVDHFKRTLAFETSDIKRRGWLFDVLKCVERIATNEFTVEQVYAFEGELAIKHPENKFVKDKIRQQLQFLRDKGFIEPVSRGRYRKV